MDFRLLLLFFLITGFAANSFAQKFAPLGSVWEITYSGEQSGESNYNCSRKIFFTVDEERVIQGRTYRIMKKDTLEVLIIWEAGNKIYYYEEDSFYLMMDFDLKVGDTLFHKTPATSYFDFSCCCSQMTDAFVQSVVTKDSILTFNGRNLRYYQFSSTYHAWYDKQTQHVYTATFDFVEGMGVYNGFIMPFFKKPICCFAVCICTPRICYKMRGLKMGSGCVTENPPLPPLPEIPIRIYPSLAIEKVFISTPKPMSLKVFSIAGQQVLNISVEGYSEVDVSSLSSGIYFFRLTSTDEVITKKIVVTRM